jgi:CheY-like chemotaxis protein
VNEPQRSVKQTILIIEDEEDVRQMIALTLSLRGYDTVTASSGEEALRVAASRPFDLVICDMKMPGMDGVETTARLRALCPSLRIVIATGFLSDAALAACSAEGAIAYLRKPFEIDELHRLVAATLAA